MPSDRPETTRASPVEVALAAAVAAMRHEAARPDATPEGIAARTVEAFLSALPDGLAGGASVRVTSTPGDVAHNIRVLAGEVARLRARKEVADGSR